jgi:hypothetical protein
MTTKERTDPYLDGVWIKCRNCDDFFCVVHDMHVYDCPCPPIEEFLNGGNTMTIQPESLASSSPHADETAATVERDTYEALLDEGISEEYYSVIPTRMLPGLYRYVLEGIKPGAFLTAIITNDLRTAISTADEENLKLIKVWVLFFWWHTPSNCHGSEAVMARWISRLRPYGN